MFGQDNTQVAASTPVQDPAMLDNVSTQPMFQQPVSDPMAQQQTVFDPAQAMQPQMHQMVADNPFAQGAVPQQAPATAMPVYDPATHSPSGPVDPPVLAQSPMQDDQNNYLAAITTDDSGDDSITDVDHDKLADMKQQALAHLEPLADHLDGTPEETFKTTMMMIQASDNHTLLEKALEAAKNIADDKTRAQAMLDIINEINYFSQNA